MERILKEDALNIPNLLTALRMALLPAIVWRFRGGDEMGALLIYLAAMMTDTADGVIARRTNQITAIGKLMDPLADKLCLLTLLALFAADGQIPVWLLNLVIAKEAVLVLGSAVALRFGIVVSALPIGKLTTMAFILSTAARFLSLRVLADLFLWVSLLLSFAALIWYGVVFVRKLQLRKVIV